MGSNTPERMLINRGLEYEEHVRFIVRIDRFTIGAKVLRAVRTAVPLSNDLAHVPIAKRKGMCEVM